MAIHPQFRSSATPGAAPDVADMLKHEVAINTADAKLFAKDVNDVLQEYSITGETITRFVISQADATANPAQVGERIRIVATSETISLPFPQDPVQGQTITIITHQDSDSGFFAELSSTGIPFRVEDTESTAPHVLRFSADDNGTETAVDGEYMLTFTGAFWTLDNPVSLSLVPNALHWRSGNADFYAGELAAGRSVTVLADDGHLYKLSTDRTVYLGEVPDGVVRNNLTPEHIDSVVWTVSVNRNDRWNGTAWAPHPGAQGSPDPIPGIPSVDPSALANTARGEYADWIRLDSRVEYVRGATYENLLVKSDDSVSSKIIDDLSTGRRKVGDIISIESFFRASDYADGLPHGFNKAVIVDGQHGTLSDTLFAVGDYRLKLLFDDDIYRATQLGAKDDLTDYSSFLRNLTENVAAGKTLVFDDFTYHITALKIFSNTTVKTSNGGSFRCIDGTGVDSGSNYYLLYNLGESGVVYDSIVVDGNKANNSAFNLFDAITCVGDKSKVINCKVTNAADSGIFIGDGANMYAGNNEIEGATDAGIYANRNTVHTGEYSVTIENNQIHDCTEAGIAVKRVAQKVNVNTNTVTGTCDVGISLTKAGDVSAFGILGKSSINGNTVDTAGGLCVAVHNSKHVSVANNVLSLTGTTSDPAIVDIGGSKAVSVSGNTIAGDKQTNGATQIKGILIRDRERNAGDTDPANNDISEGVTISSNAISDCDVAHNILIMPGGNVSENIKYRGNVIIDCNAEFSVSPGVDTVNLSDAAIPKTVDNYGADPTGTADSTAAFTAMHTDTDGVVIANYGTYRVENFAIDGTTKLFDASRAVIRNQSAGLPTITTAGTVSGAEIKIREADNTSASGPVLHIVNQFTDSVFELTDTVHRQVSSPVVKIYESEGATSVYANEFTLRRCYSITTTPTTPVFDVLSDGNSYSGNKHAFYFVWGNEAAPILSLRNGGLSHCVNNSVFGLVAEKAEGGVVHFSGQNGLALYNISSHDVVTWREDQFKCLDDGRSSRAIKIDNVRTLSGTKGIYKTISLAGATDATLVNCGGHSTGTGQALIDFSGVDCVYTGRDKYLAALNDENVQYAGKPPSVYRVNARFSTAGLLAAGAIGVSSNAAVTNTTEYTITLDDPIPDWESAAVVATNDTSAVRVIDARIINSTTVYVETFDATGASASADYKINITQVVT